MVLLRVRGWFHVYTSRPLQWAVQNKHEACVEMLMELYPESSQMNVLDTNGFGKSALTDVSTFYDTKLSLLLCWCVVTALKGFIVNRPQVLSAGVPRICTIAFIYKNMLRTSYRTQV